MIRRKDRVCPVEMAGALDIGLRRWFQNPTKILAPHIRPGMTVLDFGCGPGFFTVDMARLVGPTGRVVVADLQDGMLDIVRKKVRGHDVEPRVSFHRCSENALGFTENVDFILAFYIMHEHPHASEFFREAAAIVNPGGTLLIVEPPFHVSRKAFDQTVKEAKAQGFVHAHSPRVFMGMTAVMNKES